ncbi:hypothetical protein Tco_1151212 [Tanacetum coccineum]
MRKQANQKRWELTFLVGDHVFLKIQPYRQKTLAKRHYEKMSPRFFGPYRVKRAVGPVAYKLELPPEARTHSLFHILMLKPTHGSFSSIPVTPLPITKDLEIDLQPNSVTTHRWVYEAGQPVLKLLISWCNRPEGSNDKDSPLKVYSRRKDRITAAKVGQLYQAMLQKNLMSLAAIADAQPPTPQLSLNPSQANECYLACNADAVNTIPHLANNFMQPSGSNNGQKLPFQLNSPRTLDQQQQ